MMIIDNIYQSARRRWMSIMVVFAGIVVVLGAAGQDVLSYTMAVMAVLVGVGFWYKRKPSQEGLVKEIHDQLPTSEYSLDLLSKSSDQLSNLEQIQLEKIISKVDARQFKLSWDRPLLMQLGVVTGMLAVVIVLSQMGINDSKELPLSSSSESVVIKVKESDAADTLILLSHRIVITPPAYTGRRVSSSDNEDIEMAEGSSISWNYQWSGVANSAYLFIEDQKPIAIQQNIAIQKTFYTPSYYKYEIEGEKNSIISDYHSIKVIEDKVPIINITGIDEYQRLSYKEDYKIEFGIEASDDYALDSAHIVATIAKGQGESVKFRERKYQLSNFKRGAAEYQGEFSFSTGKLTMEPGDELYFYIATKDNCPYRQQWSRSPTYFVMLEDTATYFFAEDQGMQVDLMPEFFRSQRQIIIDSEKLLQERSSITKEDFNSRSNELGFDQKQLRLKYGQFLGEEAESGIAIENEVDVADEDHDDHDHDEEGHDHGATSQDVIGDFMHDHDHEEEHGALMATKGTEAENTARPSWVEELSHNHDNMEEASFHQVAVKSKLKAALSEMWDAELHLRLYDPKTSLPYQNKSLKLLQEIKNHARIYVHRVGFDPPAIKESEKRLSGDLDEIAPARNNAQVDQEYSEEKIRQAHESISANRYQTAAVIEVTEFIAARVQNEPSLLPLLNDLEQLLRGDHQPARVNRIKVGLFNMYKQDPGRPVVTPLFDHPITRDAIREMRTQRR